MRSISLVGLDVHAAQTHAAILDTSTGELRGVKLRLAPVEVVDFLAGLPGPVQAVYEAGPTGFGLARHARALGIDVQVVAAGKVPRASGDRVKTDRRDAERVAPQTDRGRHPIGPERVVERTAVPAVEPHADRAVRVEQAARDELTLVTEDLDFSPRRGIALEGAIKLKEISYIHAEGVTGGELKHGPIAMLDDNFPVIAMCTTSATKDKMVSNVHEIVARNAPVLALVTEGDHSLDGVATDLFVLPAVEEAAGALLNTVMLQLFAYHVAVELGQDVDQPRNLAKSVTVE